MDRFFKTLVALDEKRKSGIECGMEPGGILMQWHITERCNLKCSHCYQNESAGAEVNFNGLTAVLEQFEDLIAAMNAKTKQPERLKREPVENKTHGIIDTGLRAGKKSGGVRAHVTVTGGEPFIREDFFELLETLYERRRSFSYAILTNGTMIDRKMAEKLARLKPGFVQVSVEGDEQTHDSIRGAGSHALAVKALRELKTAGVRTLVSFTAHKGNFRKFPEAVKTARNVKADRVWADRLVAEGRGAGIAEMSLESSDTKEFFEIMKKCEGGVFSKLFSGTEVSMRRSLQFLVGGHEPYRCGAGNNLITVMPDGTVYPCRRLPISCGNIFKTSLLNIYENGPLMKKLREFSAGAAECSECAYSKLCGGGARCISNATTGDPFAKDPGCWIKR